MKNERSITYEQAGVSPARATQLLEAFGSYLKTRPRDPNVVSGIGPFASTYALGPMVKGMEDPLLVTCCDGVGTKLKLALDWGSIDGIGHDLVAMNVNDLLCCGALPFQFLDYFACGKIEHESSLRLLKSIQSGCETAGCALVGGETAEMPGVYHGQDIDLAGFAVGVVDRSKVLGAERIQLGDRVIALASSGLHSNGYSLARKLIEAGGLKPESPTAFDPKQTWAQAFLAPTRIYTKTLAPVLPQLHALAHITGGGLFENLPRVLGPKVSARIDAQAWPWTPLFRWMQKQADLSDEQMLSTFNCGVGMIAVCSPTTESALRKVCEGAGIPTAVLGEIVARGKNPTVIWDLGG